MNLSLDYLYKLIDLEMNVKYFEQKMLEYNFKHWTDPDHINYRRLMLNHQKMLEIYDIFKITAKRTDIGIKMFLQPHNF